METAVERKTGAEGMFVEQIIEMEVERLKDFRDHPFSVVDDDEMKDLMDSIRRFGILSPILVRPSEDGKYEVISGHRRKHAAKKLGYRKVPVLIRVMDDDDAVISMVDANLHRQYIRPSEKAFAIKMKYDAIRRNNGRNKKGSQRESRVKGKRSIHVISEEIGDSPKQVQRYLKITELIPEMLALLDEGRIGFNPAFETAFLSEEGQRMVLDAMKCLQSSPSLSQAQRIRKLEQNGELTLLKAREILSEVKKGQINRVTFKNEQLYQFFPRNYPARLMKQDILDILMEWKRQHKEVRFGVNTGSGELETKEADESKESKVTGSGADSAAGKEE